ncbi:MAG: NAD(P)-dependent oxidoreductase [Thermoanaerobaculia bacterium]
MSDQKPTILIAADVDPWLIERLARDARFVVELKPAYRETELAAAVGSCDAIVTRFHNEVTARVIGSAPRLRVIVQGTSGLDNIAHDAAEARGVAIVGIPGENANAVAELVIGHIVALTRTVPLYDRMVRSGDWDRADCASRHELRAHRLGIVGLGRVGGRLARLATALGMSVAAYDPYITDENFRERSAARRTSLQELLSSSDILSLHVPLTSETRAMIGRSALESLPSGAIVVNTSRGPVLDLDAALQALAEERIAGLALDVFEDEPPRVATWPRDPRLILTPHVAGCTAEAKKSIAEQSYLRLCDFFGLAPIPQ